MTLYEGCLNQQTRVQVQSRAHGRGPLKTLPTTEVRKVGKGRGEASSLGRGTDWERELEKPLHSPTHVREDPGQTEEQEGKCGLHEWFGPSPGFFLSSSGPEARDHSAGK